MNQHHSSRVTTQQEIDEALASLQLPQMPSPPRRSSGDSSNPPPPTARHAVTKMSKTNSSTETAAKKRSSVPSQRQHSPPTITILVVADLDLRSASALSEYTLAHQLTVDLCIACGSFCRDEDLQPYLRGKQQQQQQQQQNEHQPQRQGGIGKDSSPHTRRGSNAFTNSSTVSIGRGPDSGWSSTPLFRTREQTAALEGLMTATLSQLENIVCRVVYCPGASDPLTCIINTTTSNSTSTNDRRSGSSIASHHHPRRLTPNSRNLHQQWLPLAPGLGAAALLYLDCPESVLRETRNYLLSQASDNTPISQFTPPTPTPPSMTPHHHHHHHHHSLLSGHHHSPPITHHDDAIEEDEGAEDVAAWIEQLQQLQQNCQGYCSTLERLLKLAPPMHHAVPLAQPTQTILVTHYVDCTPLLLSNQQHQHSTTQKPIAPPSAKIDYDYLPANGCPAWTIETEDDDDDIIISDPSSSTNNTSQPWPPFEHTIFHSSTLTQQRLCLEIASGSPSQHPPELVQKKNSNTKILLPGSLRERGEFSVVHVSLQETMSSNITTASARRGDGNECDASSDDDNQATASPSKVVHASNNNNTRTNNGTASPRKAAAAATSSKRAFSWVVQNVDFYKLNERKA